MKPLDIMRPIMIANSHDYEFASHRMDLASLRFRFAIFKMRSISQFEPIVNSQSKICENFIFSGNFFLFFPVQFHCSIIVVMS